MSARVQMLDWLNARIDELEIDIASEKRAHARTQAEAAAMVEVVACANYLLVSFGNPHHAPIAKKRLESAFLALWKLLGVSEDDPFLPHPYDAAMDTLRQKSAGRAIAERVKRLEAALKAARVSMGHLSRGEGWTHADDEVWRMMADALDEEKP